MGRDGVEKRAYAIWEEEGRPEGQAEAHWHRAETELRAATAEPAIDRALAVTGEPPAEEPEAAATSPSAGKAKGEGKTKAAPRRKPAASKS